MLDEKRLKVFIDGANRYFNKISATNVSVGSPFFMECEKLTIRDYTGIINISGPHTGKVYFSAPKALLRYILVSLGEIKNTTADMLDLVGEIANTISGNARTEFGSEFIISPPEVSKVDITSSHLPEVTRAFILPLTWKKYQARIIVCLKEEPHLAQ